MAPRYERWRIGHQRPVRDECGPNRSEARVAPRKKPPSLEDGGFVIPSETRAVTVIQNRISTRTIGADTLTPVSAALRLRDRFAFLLESVEGSARFGRHSILGVTGSTLTVRDGEAAHAVAGSSRRTLSADPLEALREVLPALPDVASSVDLPFPLASGVGYLAYEVAAQWEILPVPAANPVDLPEAFFHLPDAVVVFDHLSHLAVIATLRDDGDHALDQVVSLLEQPAAEELPRVLDATSELPADDEAARHRFEDGVGRLVAEIRAGEMLQAVLARRFTVPTARSSFDVYRGLRRLNPSPYMFLVRLGLGEEAPALVGASPELLVRVRDRQVVTRPIAGTRPRDDDPAIDTALELELGRDSKELAEHAMLVDLARNDVGRVAEAGSVEVPILRAVERYSHVMHLVSEVHGRLRADRDAFDAIRAAFPAGTVSGAPKLRAMEAIAELEEEQRGPYGGAVGFFSPTEVEAAITIRSAVLRDGRAFVHAGAGIVADSTPSHESAEVAAKAAATLLSVGGGR
jgi:anthranilate synthase component 1